MTAYMRLLCVKASTTKKKPFAGSTNHAFSLTTPVFKRKSSEPPFSKFSQIIRAQLSRQWLNRLAQANSIQVDIPIGRHTHSVHFHSTLIMLRRLSQKENFQHQPSILSWKILARLVFTCCRKSTSPVTLEDLLFAPVIALQS